MNFIICNYKGKLMYYPPAHSYTDRYNDSSETVKRCISIPKHEEKHILKIWSENARRRGYSKSQYARVLFREDDEKLKATTDYEMQPMRYAQ